MHLLETATMPAKTRARGSWVAWALTLAYIAAIGVIPLVLSHLHCLTDLTHATPLPLLTRNWLACHIREDHLDVGAYGNWMGGMLLLPVLYWLRRTWMEQAAVAEEQRRAVFLATLRQQHERFEALALRIDGALREAIAAARAEASAADPIQGLDGLIQRLLRSNPVEVKAGLRRNALAEEYVAEGKAFLAALERFDFGAFSGGPWRDLMRTLERLLPA